VSSLRATAVVATFLAPTPSDGLAVLALVACAAGDRVGAVQLVRRTEQIMAGKPARRPGCAATS
jgi:hypothetical protein